MRLENRYEVVRLLGQGAFGRVLHVRDRATKKEFAAKELLATGADARNRFFNEARQQAVYGGIGVPHVLPVEAAFLEDEPPFFLMKLVEAGSIVKWAGRLRPEQVIEVMRQLIETIALIHLTGGFHRDIKPDNILLLGDGSIVLGDFGLGNQPLVNGPGTNSAAGTPGYIAPELYQQDAIDPASFSAACDYYSVGATGFHLLTGLHPKDFQPPLNLATMDVIGTLKSVPDETFAAYPLLIPLILQLTDPDPTKRLPLPAGTLLLLPKIMKRSLEALPTTAPPPLSAEELLVTLAKRFVQARNAQLAARVVR